MGRAHEVRAASMAKTAAKKSKLYAVFAKEISKAAKGNPDPVNNLELRRIIEKAKREQVPSEVINRNIDKVKKGDVADYLDCTYEAYGPGGSSLIIECLTDNTNRALSDLKTCFNKCGVKLASQNSVSFMYEHAAIFGVKNTDEDSVMEALINNDADASNIEIDEDLVVVYAEPSNYNKVKTALESLPNIEFEVDEIEYFPNETVTLDSESKEKFDKLLTMLDDVDDVSKVYHNVNL